MKEIVAKRIKIKGNIDGHQSAPYMTKKQTYHMNNTAMFRDSSPQNSSKIKETKTKLSLKIFVASCKRSRKYQKPLSCSLIFKRFFSTKLRSTTITFSRISSKPDKTFFKLYANFFLLEDSSEDVCNNLNKFCKLYIMRNLAKIGSNTIEFLNVF